MTTFVVIDGTAHRFRAYSWPNVEAVCGKTALPTQTTTDPSEPFCKVCENVAQYPESATRPDLHDYGPREEPK